MTAPPSGESEHAFERAVEELIVEVGRIGRELGMAGLAASLIGATRPDRPVATVVVAGAAGRGKTALVNALIDRPGLLPVGARHAVDAAVTDALQERARLVAAQLREREDLEQRARREQRAARGRATTQLEALHTVLRRAAQLGGQARPAS